jgi:hypothetical protein
MILAGLAVTACNYEPPSVGAAGAGGTGGDGGMAGSPASSSSASSSSTSSSSGMPGAEMCANDLDDDMNGTADCADPACGAYKCLMQNPVAGEMWTGPFHASYVAFDAPEPPCANDQALPKAYGIGPAVPGCTQCDCNLTDAVCKDAVLTCYDTLTCMSVSGMVGQFSGNNCDTLGGLYGSCQVTTPPSIFGTPQCNIKKNAELLQPKSFDSKLLRCDTPLNTGTGCTPGTVCGLAPNPGYDFLCIAASGQHQCPNSDWSIFFFGYETWSDTRSCSTCSCNTGAATCPPSFLRHYESTCSMTGAPILTGDCAKLTGAVSIESVERPPLLPLVNGCTAESLGSFDYGGETTICCRPAP